MVVEALGSNYGQGDLFFRVGNSLTVLLVSCILKTLPEGLCDLSLPPGGVLSLMRRWDGCNMSRVESSSSSWLCSRLGLTCLLTTGLSYCMRLPDHNVTPSWLRDSTPRELSLCVFAIITVFLKTIFQCTLQNDSYKNEQFCRIEQSKLEEEERRITKLKISNFLFLVSEWDSRTLGAFCL